MMDNFSQLLRLHILDTFLGLIVNQVQGAEQTQRESMRFVPVNLQLTDCCHTFRCSGVCNR